MSRKNGYVLVDISDGRVMTVGLDAETIGGNEVPGINIIENGVSKKFLFPVYKSAGSFTIATLEDIPEPTGGKIYRHKITIGLNSSPQLYSDGIILSFTIVAYSSSSSEITIDNLSSNFYGIFGRAILKSGSIGEEFPAVIDMAQGGSSPSITILVFKGVAEPVVINPQTLPSFYSYSIYDYVTEV